MEQLSFRFRSYSPVELDSDQQRALERVFGLPPEATAGSGQQADRSGELLDLLCRVVNTEVGQRERETVDVLGVVRTAKKDDHEPVAIFKTVWESSKSGRSRYHWETRGYVGAVRLRLRKGTPYKLFGGRSGTLCRDADVTIRIGSDFDPDNDARFLRYMLEGAFALPAGQKAEGMYTDMSVESALGVCYDRLLLRLFFLQLHRALGRGLYRQYQEFAHNDANLRGRIDVPRHIRENPLPNGRICYVTREYTADNAVNQLILKAAARLRQHHRRSYTDALKGDELCAKGLATLEGELFDRPEVTDRQAIQAADKPIVHPVYRAYEPLRLTCLAILRHMGVDPLLGGKGTFSGLLLNIPELWELFLQNAVFRGLAHPPAAQPSYYILDARRLVRPDFYFPDQGLILDAKYKPAWKEAYHEERQAAQDKTKDPYWPNDVREDLYQVISYMYLFRCGAGGVIFPVSDPVAQLPIRLKFDPVSKEGDPKVTWTLQEKFLLFPFYVPQEGSPEDFRATMEANIQSIRAQINGMPP